MRGSLEPPAGAPSRGHSRSGMRRRRLGKEGAPGREGAGHSQPITAGAPQRETGTGRVGAGDGWLAGPGAPSGSGLVSS